MAEEAKGQRFSFQDGGRLGARIGDQWSTQTQWSTQSTWANDTSGVQSSGVFLPWISGVNNKVAPTNDFISGIQSGKIQSNIQLPWITDKTPTYQNATMTAMTPDEIDEMDKIAKQNGTYRESWNDRIHDEMLSNEYKQLLKQWVIQTWNDVRKFSYRKWAELVDYVTKHPYEALGKYGWMWWPFNIWGKLADKVVVDNNPVVKSAWNVASNKMWQWYYKYEDKINKNFEKRVDKNISKTLAEEYQNSGGIWESIKNWDTDNIKYWLVQWFSTSILPMTPWIIAWIVTKNPYITAWVAFGSTAPIEDQEAYEEAIKEWATKEQATEIWKYAWVINGALETVWEFLQIKWLLKPLKKNITKEITKKTGRQIIARWLKEYAQWVWSEALTEWTQEFVTNALIKTINENKDLFEWVLDSIIVWWALSAWPSTLWAWGKVMQDVQNNEIIDQKTDLEALDYILEWEKRKAQRIEQQKEKMRQRANEKFQAQAWENAWLSDTNDYTEWRNVWGSKPASETTTEESVNTLDAEETISDVSSHSDSSSSDSFFSTDENWSYIEYDWWKLYAWETTTQSENKWYVGKMWKSMFTWNEYFNRNPEYDDYRQNFNLFLEKLKKKIDDETKNSDVIVWKTQKWVDMKLTRKQLKHIIKFHWAFSLNDFLETINNPTYSRMKKWWDINSDWPFFIKQIPNSDKFYFLWFSKNNDWSYNIKTFYEISKAEAERLLNQKLDSSDNQKYQLKYEEEWYNPWVAGKNEKNISWKEGVNLRNKLNKKTVKELAEKYGIKVEVIEWMIKILEKWKRKWYAYWKYIDQLLTLSEQIKESTAPHELLHAIFDMIDPETKAYLISQVMKSEGWSASKAEEWLADSFSNFFRTGKIEWAPKSTWGKIKIFFKRVRSFINGMGKWRNQLEEIFTDIIESEGIEDLQWKIDRNESINKAKERMRERFKQYQKNAQKMQKKEEKNKEKYQKADDIDPEATSPENLIEVNDKWLDVMVKFVSEKQKKNTLDVSKEILTSDGKPYMWTSTNKYKSKVITDWRNVEDSKYKEYTDKWIQVARFTNNSSMSYSYADYKSKLAPVKKFKSIDELNKFFKENPNNYERILWNWIDDGVLKSSVVYEMKENDGKFELISNSTETLTQSMKDFYDGINNDWFWGNIWEMPENKDEALKKLQEYYNEHDYEIDWERTVKLLKNWNVERTVVKEPTVYKRFDTKLDALAEWYTIAQEADLYHYQWVIQKMKNPLVVDIRSKDNASSTWSRLWTVNDIFDKEWINYNKEVDYYIRDVEEAMDGFSERMKALEQYWNDAYRDDPYGEVSQFMWNVQISANNWVTYMVDELEELLNDPAMWEDLKIGLDTEVYGDLRDYGRTLRDVITELRNFINTDRNYYALKKLSPEWIESWVKDMGAPKEVVKMIKNKNWKDMLGNWRDIGDKWWRENIKELLTTNWMDLETNDWVKYALDSGKYDWVIFKNIIDYGWLPKEWWDNAKGGDVAVTFRSNQFKTWDNEDPTDSKYIRYQKMDDEYAEAVENWNTTRAKAILREYAKEKWYDSSTDYQWSLAFNGSAPASDGLTKEERVSGNEDIYSQTLWDFASDGLDWWDLERQLDPNWWLWVARARASRKLSWAEYDLESINNLRNAVMEYKKWNKDVKIRMYRAIDSDIKEEKFRNWDWITPSKEYAKHHIDLQDWKKGRVISEDVSIEDIRWDGNDINERWFDNEREYGYKDTPNNRKELEITYDDNGNLIPLSERFNENVEDERYQRVYHWSPAEFDRFDSSHMWEWEWDQVHGRWHYVAVDPKTGKEYAETLAWPRYKGKEMYELASDLPWYQWNVINHVAEQMRDGVDIENAISNDKKWHEYLLNKAEENLKTEKDEDNIDYLEREIKQQKEMIKIADWLKVSDFETSRWRRNFYEVEIPDIVDADTPTWTNYFEENKVLTRSEIEEILNKLLKRKTQWAERVKNAIDYDLKDWEKIDGRAMVFNLRAWLWNKKASKFLESLGYDGIHYFWGKDWEAYVIFNDNDLEIKNHEKYQKTEYEYDENGKPKWIKFWDNSEFDPSIFWENTREEQIEEDKENEKGNPFYNAWMRYNNQNYKDDQKTFEEFMKGLSDRADKEQEIYDEKMKSLSDAQNDPKLLELQLKAVKLMEKEQNVGKKFWKNVSKEVRDRQQAEVEKERENLVKEIFDYMYPWLKFEDATYEDNQRAFEKEAEWEMLGKEDIENKLKLYKKDKNGNREAKEIKIENPDIKLDKLLSAWKFDEIFEPTDRVIEWKTPQWQHGTLDSVKDTKKFKSVMEKINSWKTKTKVELKDVTQEARAYEKQKAMEEAEKERKKKEQQEAKAKKKQEEYKKMVRMKAFQRLVDMQRFEKYPFLTEEEIKNRYGFSDEEWKTITEQEEIKLPKKRWEKAISDFNKAVDDQVKYLIEWLNWQNNMKMREAEKNLGEIGEIDLDVLLGKDEEKGAREVEEFEKIAEEEKKKSKKEKNKRLEQAREDVTQVEIDKERENSKSEKERVDKIIKSTKTDKTVRWSAKETATNVITPVSTRIRKISPKIYRELMRYFQNKDIITNERLKEIDPFLKAMGKIRKENPVRFMDIWVALANRNIWYANGLLQEYGVKVPTKLLDTIYDEAEDVGLNINYLWSYYPLSVKAPKSFKEELMKVNKWDIASDIEKRIQEESKKKWWPLDESEVSAIINDVIAWEEKWPDVNTWNKHLKKRNTEIERTPQMLEYCDDPISTIIWYIEWMTQSIERAKFLGKSRSWNIHDLWDYVYNAKNGLMPDQQDELMELLKSVFNDESPNKFFQAWRDIATLTTLWSPSSTLTQLSDLSFSIYENGWRETLKAVWDIFASRKGFDLQDMWVVNRWEEYTNINSQKNLLQKAIHNVFTYGNFFSQFDTFWKSTFIQSTWRKRQKRAKIWENGDPQLRKDIQKWTDDEYMTDKIINDLKKWVFSEDVALVMYMKLWNIQPLTKAQMPKAYLDHPNRRIFYQFKTFGIKQLDYVLQETKENMKWWKNLSTTEKYLRVAQVANMIFIMTLMWAWASELKDITMRRRSNSILLRWLFGEDVGTKQVWDKVEDSALQLFWLSRYTVMQAKSDPVDAILSLFTTVPATNIIEYPFRDILKAFKNDGSINWSNPSSYQLIPVVWKYRYWIYWWWQEKQQEALDKEKKKAEKENSKTKTKKKTKKKMTKKSN